jgi:hypothetical protein
LKLGIDDGALEIETIFASHGAAHMIHRFQDVLATIAQNQVIKF